jgi:hypothetical protein
MPQLIAASAKLNIGLKKTHLSPAYGKKDTSGIVHSNNGK